MQISPFKVGFFSKTAEIFSAARSEWAAKTVQNSYFFSMFPIIVTNLWFNLFVRGVHHHLNENKPSNILFTGVLIENSASSQSDMPC